MGNKTLFLLQLLNDFIIYKIIVLTGLLYANARNGLVIERDENVLYSSWGALKGAMIA